MKTFSCVDGELKMEECDWLKVEKMWKMIDCKRNREEKQWNRICTENKYILQKRRKLNKYRNEKKEYGRQNWYTESWKKKQENNSIPAKTDKIWIDILMKNWNVRSKKDWKRWN